MIILFWGADDYMPAVASAAKLYSIKKCTSERRNREYKDLQQLVFFDQQGAAKANLLRPALSVFPLALETDSLFSLLC